MINKKQKVSPQKGSFNNKEGLKKDSSTVSQVRKSSEYGRQLAEKQRVKEMYGMREAQFKVFFSRAKKSKSDTGSSLLVLLERRLDNVLFRLKFTKTRLQARKIVVHGHVCLNGKKVFSPSIVVDVQDVITIVPKSLEKKGLTEEIFNKQFATGTKVPEWLELDKSKYEGKILRLPVRSDIQASINENFIVELYSK
jgi:small subunit ribosomal protein S4